MEQDVERLVGLPAGALGLIRTRGERSNMDQVSSAGARGVYQITPTTARLIQQKYGFDPLASPSAMAKGAALILKEGMDRTGSLEGGVRQYHGGTNPANYGDVNRAYVARVMGGVEAGGGFVNPFDPKYGQAALAQLDAGAQAAMTPQSMTVDMSGAPEMPKPVQAAATDFTQADAAFARAKPQEFTADQQYQTQVDGFFSGMGRALMQLPDGAGLGKVLAALGGGASVGLSGANAEIRARQDKFNEQMQAYELASANREGQKAQLIHAEMQHNVDQQNAYALNKWKDESDRFYKTNGVSVQGDAFISSTMGKDGKLTITRTPIRGAVQAALATSRASLLMQMGNQSMQGASMVAQNQNSLLLSAAAMGAQMQGDAEAQAGGVVMGAAGLATALVSTGRVASVVGDEGAMEALDKEVTQTLVGQYKLAPGSKDYSDMYQQVMAERLTAAIASNPKFRERAVQYGGPAQAVMQAGRMAEAKTTITRGPRGTTTREQY